MVYLQKISKILSFDYLQSIIFILLCFLGYYLFDWLGILIVLLLGLFLYSIIFSEKIVLFWMVISVGLTVQFLEQGQDIITLALSALVFIIWAFKKIRNGFTYQAVPKEITTIICLFIFWSMVSSIFSEFPFYSIYFSFKTIFFFVIIYIIYDWSVDYSIIRILQISITSTGTIAALFSLSEILRINSLVHNGQLVRIGGLFSGVNALGLLFSFAIPITILLFVKSNNKFYFLSLILMSISLFFTFSRAAWLSVIVSITIILYNKRWFRITVLSLFLFIILSLVFSKDAISYFNLYLRLESVTSYRDILWNSAIKMIADFPILGVGPHNIGFYMVKYSGINPTSWLGEIVTFSREDAHNFFLTTGAEMGLLGLVLAISIFGSFYFYWFKIDKKEKKHDISSKVYLAIITGTLFRAFFEGNAIITKGYLGFDIYFWLVYIFMLKIYFKKKVHTS